MASRVLILLAVIALLTQNCKCDWKDDFLEDYYTKLLFRNSFRNMDKRKESLFPNENNITTGDIAIDIAKSLPRSRLNHTSLTKVGIKRNPNDVSDIYESDQQESDGRYIVPVKYGMRPCYCKYLVR